MRTETVTKTYNIYKYEELSEEVKKRVLNNFREQEIEDRFYWLLDDLKERLDYNYNLKDVEIDYSFGYCQGDGVCFYSDRNILSYIRLRDRSADMNEFERTLIECLSDAELEKLLNYLNEDYSIKLIKTNHHYPHKYTCEVNCEYYYGENNINDLLTKVCDIIRDIYYSICDELEKIGYAVYDVSEDDIIELIEGNGYEFLEDGSIY